MRGHIYISFHSPSFIDTPNVQGYTGSSLVEQEYKHLIFHFKIYIHQQVQLPYLFYIMSTVRTSNKLPTFRTLPTQIQRDPTGHYEQLYQVAKQIFKRYTNMIREHRQLQHCHNLMKTHYIELKAELVLKDELLRQRRQQQQRRPPPCPQARALAYIYNCLNKYIYIHTHTRAHIRHTQLQILKTKFKRTHTRTHLYTHTHPTHYMATLVYICLYIDTTTVLAHPTPLYTRQLKHLTFSMFFDMLDKFATFDTLDHIFLDIQYICKCSWWPKNLSRPERVSQMPAFGPDVQKQSIAKLRAKSKMVNIILHEIKIV